MTLPELAAVRDELSERREKGERPGISDVMRAAAEARAERGIPIPSRAYGMGKSFSDKLRCLAVGDSLLLPGLASTEGLHGYWKHLAPQRYSTRAVPGGVRVWRVA